MGAVLALVQWIPGVKSLADAVWSLVMSVVDFTKEVLSWPVDIIRWLLGTTKREISSRGPGPFPPGPAPGIGIDGVVRLLLGLPLVLLGAVASLLGMVLSIVVGLVLAIVRALLALVQWIPGVRPVADAVWNLVMSVVDLARRVLNWPLDIIHWLLGHVDRVLSEEESSREEFPTLLASVDRTASGKDFSSVMSTGADNV